MEEDNHAWLSEVLASEYWTGDIPDKIQPYISPDFQETKSTTNRKSSDSNATKDEFDQLSKKRRKLLTTIEDDLEDEWTVNEAADESGISDNTVRSYVNDFKENGWVTETGDKKNRSKVYTLIKSRYKKPSIAADGGVNWDYRERWPTAVRHIRSENYLKLADSKYQDEENYDRDWFLNRNVEPVATIFEHISEVNDLLWEIHQNRKELDEDWSWLMEFTRKEMMDEIWSSLQSLADEFRDIFTKFKQLVGTGFDNCSKWLDSKTGKGASNSIEKEHNPEGKKQKCKQRLDAKQYALIRTHIQPLLKLDPEHQKNNPDYVDQVYDLEKSVRAFLHWAWDFYKHLVDGTSPPAPEEEQEDSDEDPIAEEDRPVPEVMKEEEEYSLPQPTKVLQTTLENAWEGPISLGGDGFGDALSWDELVDEYTGYINSHRVDDTPTDTTIATRLEKLQDYYWRGEGDHVGVYVWDKNEFDPTEEQELQIKLVKSVDESWAADNDRYMDWPEHRDLEIPPL
ncbi:hypothetical protein [Natrinema thermotolerans]|uniref:hypothetical protein n=1 Tax=Natrinema thermotolerans TaxID=121872 RepID=UPI0010A4793C|nr:hypothetical protein [Natrinema thermotolerans]